MRQIKITRDYNGALGRYFRGICILRQDAIAAQLVQDGFAEYADPEPRTSGQLDPTERVPPVQDEEDATEPQPDPTERVPPEAAVAEQGENAMRPRNNGKKVGL